MTLKRRAALTDRPRYASWISLFLLAGCIGWGSEYAEGASEWENKIAALDLLKQEDLVTLNTSLAANGTLGYCKINEKLLPLTYEELQDLVERTDKTPSLKALHALFERALPRPEDIFLLREDIFINNKPLGDGSPFYRNTLLGAPVTDLKAHAEQVYVNNLKLKSSPHDLVMEKKDLWYGSRVLKPGTDAYLGRKENPQKKFSWTEGQKEESAPKSWSWQLKDDYRHDSLNAQAIVRQFLKHYEESPIQSVIYKNAIITRNAYRLFCLSQTTGKELWSFNPDNSGQEFYHTFRHPHQNSYGYDFLLSEGVVFSELGGRLTAVDITNVLQPSLKWIKGLGEYVLCTKPAMINGKLICGLINARGELWFCGFDAQTGALDWSKYIGSSSFLAPACTLRAVTNGEVIIATNHGVLVCLASDRGEILWLKKYTPRHYSPLDYWWKGYYKDKFWDTGNLPYDTQFLKRADSSLLYYKPRESSYFYTINSKNGETVQKLYVDPSFLYVLGAYDGKVVFLQKKDSRLIVADMRTGTELSNVPIEGGKLNGILYPKESQIIFKVDKTLYSLDLADTHRSLKKISLGEPGWFLGASEQGVLTGENRILKYLRLNSEIDPKTVPVQDQVAVHLDDRERVKKEFQKMKKVPESNKQASQLLMDIQRAGFSTNDVFSIVWNNLGCLLEPAWKGFVDGLNSFYGSRVITHQDIQMTLSSFLKGAGLIPQISYQKPAILKAFMNLFIPQKGYQIEIPETSLRPVNIIRGASPADFFILLNNGQMVCVGEKGDIWWERKIFFGPVWSGGNEEDKDRHLYSDDIEIYLYDNVLIVNDRVNVIAMDVHTGAYLWSMTNKRETLNDESQLPPLKKDWSYEARLYFTKHIMMRTEFLDDVLIVSHGDRLYALDPKTGYRKASHPSGLSCVMDMRVVDNRLYVASLIPEMHIKIFDKNLKESGDFSSPSEGENKKFWPRLVILPRYMLLHTRSNIHIFDKKNGQLMHTMGIEDFERYYIEPYNDGFIVIAPFLKTCSYRIRNGIPKKEWEFPLEPQEQRLMWDFPSFRSAYYYVMTKERILNFIRSRDDYYVLALDLSTGKVLWQTKLDGIQGRFLNLSNGIQFHGVLQFIMTCVHTGENYTNDLDLTSRLSTNGGVLAVDVDSALFRLDTQKGKLLQSQRLPSCAIFEFPGEDIVQTQDHFLYNLYRKAVQCVVKKNQ